VSDRCETAASPAEPVASDHPSDTVLGHSLGRKLVLATLAFSLLFTGLSVAARTWLAWQANLVAMNTELALIGDVFQRALAKAIWEMDREDLLAHMASMAQVQSVGCIELRLRQSGRSAEVLQQRKPGAPEGGRAPTLQRELSYSPYPGTVEVIGDFTLQGDERLLWLRLRGELLEIVLTQVIQSVLLAGLIMWLFHRSVTVHVRRIARHLATLTPETLGRPLQLQRAAVHRDELTLLEAGVNHLQGNLSDYLARQHRDERELAAHRDRLADLVDAKTTELRAVNTRLERLSRADPLTDLANRRHFDEVKETELRRARRQQLPLSLLVCDVDYFKRYNDTYGHARGDQCLQSVADALKQTFTRSGDFCARIGGEEFAVLLPALDAEQAVAAAERLRARLLQMGLPHTGSLVALHVTLSIGVAQFDEETMQRFDELMQRADEALYRAKNRGRNRVSN